MDRSAAMLEFLAARQSGRTVQDAAAAVGVHRATAHRWLAADRAFRELDDHAVAVHRAEGFEDEDDTPGRFASWRAGTGTITRRPAVAVHPDCPTCGSPVAVGRTFAVGWPRLSFWRCSAWPACSWSSWRPRHPDDCQVCGGPRLWSQSRRSIGCTRCGVRQAVL